MKSISEIYQTLLKTYGKQNWWPAETPFEVCVGAVLTQNTNWKNVEKAIENLKRENLITPEAIRGHSLLSRRKTPGAHKTRWILQAKSQIPQKPVPLRREKWRD